jgi:4-hydroxy-4-methyl-2-oxoglutarate aldolase
MTEQITDPRLHRLMQLGAATVYEAQGQKGALNSALKPLDPTRRLIGPALTVDCQPADNLALHFALRRAKPGDVLVVDAKAYVEAGPWGDVMTLAAQTSGIAGLVIDGSVRDAESIVDMGFPVFSRGVCIKCTGKSQAGRINVPIICGGTRIRPGDIMLGDRDGLVVIAAEEIGEALRLSEAREQKEVEIRAALRAGKKTVDLLGLQHLSDRILYQA